MLFYKSSQSSSQCKSIKVIRKDANAGSMETGETATPQGSTSEGGIISTTSFVAVEMTTNPPPLSPTPFLLAV